MALMRERIADLEATSMIQNVYAAKLISSCEICPETFAEPASTHLGFLGLTATRNHRCRPALIYPDRHVREEPLAAFRALAQCCFRNWRGSGNIGDSHFMVS